MGNYSTDPDAALKDALEKGYDRVRFQQGKPILDRELNLLGDLASPRRLAPYIGNGVPVGKGGLMADPPQDPSVVEFEIEPGRCIVGGLELVLNDLSSYTKQPHTDNVQTSWPFKSFSQGAKGGPGWVYLRVFTTEVDDSDDPALQNQGDLGFETTLRDKVDWEVLLSDERIQQPDHFLLAEYIATGGVVEEWRDARVVNLTLSALRQDFEEFKGDVNTKTASLNPGGDLAPDSVGNPQLKNNAVGTVEIQDLAVTTQKLNNLAVTNMKLADNSVGSNKIIDGSVGQAELADGAVITNKLAPGAVDNTKIAAGAVDSAKLAPNSVIYGKVAANSLTAANFKYLTTLNIAFSLAQGGVTNVVILHKVLVHSENFLVYNVWSDNDLSWSELMVGGSRMLKVVNNTAGTITVNVLARLILAN